MREDYYEFPVYYPDEIKLFCPECGAPIDGDEVCMVMLVKSASTASRTGYVAKLVAVCTKCGSYGKMPGCL
jgi:NMD protein affecting ribosome stability and mRNA decay